MLKYFVLLLQSSYSWLKVIGWKVDGCLANGIHDDFRIMMALGLSQDDLRMASQKFLISSLLGIRSLGLS